MYKRGHEYPGIFISFDGGDGTGKTTQYRRFLGYLKDSNLDMIDVREPGGTVIGEQVRKVLLDPENRESISSIAEFLLFSASRAQLVDHVIVPNLKKGKIVLADRFFDSSTAYQGSAGKMPLDLILYGNRVSTQGVSPDLTLIYDVTDETRIARMNPLLRSPKETFSTGEEGKDRIELKGEEYASRVRKAYLGIANLDPDRVKLIDANGNPDQVYDLTVAEIRKFAKHFGLEDKFGFQ